MIITKLNKNYLKGVQTSVKSERLQKICCYFAGVSVASVWHKSSKYNYEIMKNRPIQNAIFIAYIYKNDLFQTLTNLYY